MFTERTGHRAQGARPGCAERLLSAHPRCVRGACAQLEPPGGSLARTQALHVPQLVKRSKSGSARLPLETQNVLG